MAKMNTKEKSLIDENSLYHSSEMLRALTHPLRLSLIQFIDNERETNVNRIYKTLRLEQSITSQHLKILRQADLVKSRRDGKYVIYSLNYQKIQHVVKVLNKHI